MMNEFPEVFLAIKDALNNQDLYYLDSQQYYLENIVEHKHPVIMINDFWFMKFAKYFNNQEYIKFRVTVIGDNNFIGVLQYNKGRLQFYKNDRENEIKDFTIELLDELYEEITKPLLTVIEKMKDGIS